MENINLASVTDWKMIDEPGHNGKIPDMPKEERVALHKLSNIMPGNMTADQRLLYYALKRKLKYAAMREIEK